MTMSDTISDMLTRIRNSLMAKKPEVVFPYSTFKHNLAKVLQNEGWIAKAEVKEENDRKFLSLQLKYDNAGVPVISGIKRVSKPGQRIYSSREQIPSVLGGMGTTIVSTSKGLMKDKETSKNKAVVEMTGHVWE